MRFPPHRLASLCLVAVLAGGLGACTNRSLGSETQGRNIEAEYGYRVRLIAPEDRKPAPKVRGTTLTGDAADLASFDGVVLVVNFWASWCGPCRKEEPILERVWKANKGRRVQFVGVNIRDTVVNANAFREEFGVTFPSIFNPDSSIAAQFRLTVPPSTFIIDGRGRIAARIIGAAANEQELQRLIDEVLEA